MKYQLRCKESYVVVAPAGPMVDQNNNVLCMLPESRFSCTAGQVSQFSTKAKMKAFLASPNNSGKWESL